MVPAICYVYLSQIIHCLSQSIISRSWPVSPSLQILANADYAGRSQIPAALG